MPTRKPRLLFLSLGGTITLTPPGGASCCFK